MIPGPTGVNLQWSTNTSYGRAASKGAGAESTDWAPGKRDNAVTTVQHTIHPIDTCTRMMTW